MSTQEVRVTILGARGSMAVGTSDCAAFGGSTSCYMVEAGEEVIFLDAGSGLLRAPTTTPRPPVILLSHWHLDHLLGLGMYGRLSQEGTTTLLYAPAQDNDDATERLNHLYAPPYWPLELPRYAGELCVRAMPKELRVGSVAVNSMEGNHPGGCLAFRLGLGKKAVVYVTDYEHESISFARLASFSRDADLLLYDAQYDEDDYDAHRGFGHSTPRKGVELMTASGARRLLLIHHDPHSTDEVLDERERRLARPNVRFAREGEVIVL